MEHDFIPSCQLKMSRETFSCRKQEGGSSCHLSGRGQGGRQ
jgi:hypothetical protein